MRRLSRLAAAAAVLSALAVPPAAAGERVGDFSLIDHRGKFFQLSRAADLDAVVLFVHGDGRTARRAAADLGALAERFAGRNAAFYLLDSGGGRDKAAAARAAGRAGLDLPVLMDDTRLVAGQLGVTRAAETVVIDPKAREIVYRGALNDRWRAGPRPRRATERYAADTLDALLAGREAAGNGPPSRGAPIAFGKPDAVAWADDVAPILKERCVGCHMEGGIAPFAMTSHQMVRGWSPMIREVLLTKRMPPGQIDGDYVDDFHDVSHITAEETRALVRWIDQGAPLGDAGDPLAEHRPQTVKWSHGEPDLVIPIPPQRIPATGVQDYRNLTVPLDLEEDIWVKAVEFEAGDPTVLHHIIAFAYGPNGVNEFEVLNQGIGLGAYAPGNEVNTYPEESGFPLKAGGGLLLQMHYTTSGRETVDASEIALYLWDEPPARPVLGGSAAELDINIPPFEPRHEMTASATFRKDSYLTMIGPHMHYRGYDARFRLVYPDGAEEEILNVPNYQFNWQKVYDFKEPKFLPAGTELVFTGTFDNSAMNPFNPDPSQTLTWGEQTWQEMFFGFYRYVEADGRPAGD